LRYTESRGESIMASTYTPIATTTLGSAGSVTFNSISSSYTDLIIVGANIQSDTSTPGICIRFNSDTSTNYSDTFLEGTGTTAYSNRDTNKTYINSGYNIGLSATSNQPANVTFNIQNYANTTTYKTVIGRYAQPLGSAPGTAAVVGLWRSTSAITRIDILAQGNNFAAGSTFTLYGIAAA